LKTNSAAYNVQGSRTRTTAVAGRRYIAGCLSSRFCCSHLILYCQELRLQSWRAVSQACTSPTCLAI